MSQEQKPPAGRGRGGRGLMLLKNIKAPEPVPGSSSSEGHQAGPSYHVGQNPQAYQSGYSESCGQEIPPSTGAISKRSSVATASAVSPYKSSGYHSAVGISSESSDSSETKSSSSGRGLALARFIQKKQISKDQVPGTTARGVGQKIITTEGKKGSDGESTISSDISRLQIDSKEEENDAPMIRTGTTGETFEVLTNWIRISLSPDKHVFEYEVQFNPAVDAKNLRYKMLSSQNEVFGTVRSFDGVKLWLPRKLEQKRTVTSAKNPITNEKVQITIIYQKRTNMLKSIQLYNVLFNRCMKMIKMAMVSRNFYLPSEAIMVPQHKMEIWPGYVTAAHHQEGGAMLNIDVSHKLLRTNTVYDLMSELHSQSKSFHAACFEHLAGAVVLTRYNNKTYRIDDIDFVQNPTCTFTNSKGVEMSYCEYYETAYGMKIRDLRQPLLLSKAKKKEAEYEGRPKLIYLIPELCYMTGLTDEMRKDFRVMKDISQHTRLTPNNRKIAIDKFIKNINGNQESFELLRDWGIRLLEQPILVPARRFPAEKIQLGKPQAIIPSQPVDWGRETCSEKVLCPVDIKKWFIIYTQRNQTAVRQFINTYLQVVRNMGINVAEPLYVPINNDNIESYVSQLRKYYAEDVQMAVIVFPTQREDRYSAVKLVACAELGLPTQCINFRTISMDKKLRSVTQKIALQINCKLGGELWAVSIPMKGLMVCGVDVYHDLVKRGSSVVGFVSSLNQHATKWHSHVTFQGPGEEIVHGMVASFRRAIEAYYKLNHSYPSSIVVFRDGVGDGMLELTKNHEIPQLATVFNQIPDFCPKFYYVIVQKRINTRIFACRGQRDLDNPPPGSVVDHTITNRYLYDFLLVSQHVRQGTVSPTHYIVLQDGGGLDPDKMQRLTYKMTHMYYNWPGTIRVPAPCQYAHKLAYLIGENVKKTPKEILYDRLFFL